MIHPRGSYESPLHHIVFCDGESTTRSLEEANVETHGLEYATCFSAVSKLRFAVFEPARGEGVERFFFSRDAHRFTKYFSMIRRTRDTNYALYFFLSKAGRLAVLTFHCCCRKCMLCQRPCKFDHAIGVFRTLEPLCSPRPRDQWPHMASVRGRACRFSAHPGSINLTVFP